MNTQDRSRQILIQGLMLVLAGLVWGFVVPQTPHPRLALAAHVQFVTNGLLVIVMAVLLLKLPHRVGPRSAAVMLLATWLIWPMAMPVAQLVTRTAIAVASSCPANHSAVIFV